MKKYKITDIIEDEFGCEGRPEGEEPMVTILLVDDTGKQRSIRMADKLAYEKKLDIGAEMELPEEEIMTLNGKEHTNIDYFPTNFILWQNVLYYVDYECNAYMEEWNFENWGIKYWSKTKEFLEYEQTH